MNWILCNSEINVGRLSNLLTLMFQLKSCENLWEGWWHPHLPFLNWKLILTQNKILNQRWRFQLSLPDWLSFFFLMTRNESIPIIYCHCGYIPAAIWLIILNSRPVDTGKKSLLMNHFAVCEMGGCVSVEKVFVHLWLGVCACLCVIKAGVWNLKLKQDVQINDL